MTSPRPSRDLIALTLAIGLCTALNLLVLAVAYGAVAGTSDVDGGISENATQILTGWGGGVVGILGGVFGYRAGESARPGQPPSTPRIEEP